VICLSFDTDHLDEVRMREFLDTVHIPGDATFFCTRRYDCFEKPHELCPHPVLEEGQEWEAELQTKRAELPDAVGWRSHSCVYSHLIAQRVAASGYLYASTQFQPVAATHPFREPWGLWHLPIYYMDNLDFSHSRFWRDVDHVPFAPEVIATALADDGIYVFDFHPIHLLLNSPSADAYFARRDAFLAGENMDVLRCDGRGARTFYDELCASMENVGTSSVRMQDALAGAISAERN
jgi:polysaccharide deactylase WbmS-like protein